MNAAPSTVTVPPGSQPAFFRSCSSKELPSPSAFPLPESDADEEIISLSHNLPAASAAEKLEYGPEAGSPDAENVAGSPLPDHCESLPASSCAYAYTACGPGPGTSIGTGADVCPDFRLITCDADGLADDGTSSIWDRLGRRPSP